MVGVPGRSKACHTCRQRRIRCGREQPSCLNCTKSKRICTGYQRDHAFILSKDMGADATALAAKESGSGITMVSRWRADPETAFVASPASSSSSRSLSVPARARPTTLPQEVFPGNAIRNRLFSLFIENDLTTNDKVRIAFGERTDWMVQIMSLPDLAPALEDALLAVSLARFGRQTSRPDLLHESLKLYTKSLSELRKDMLDNSRRRGEQSLAASLSLALYEVTQCPGKSPAAYQAHYQGTMQLLKIRGPKAHASGLPHSILQIMRIHAVFQGFVERKRTFLAQTEWRHVPWPDSQPKTPFDEIVDILLDVPELFPDDEDAKDRGNPRWVLSNGLEVIYRCKAMESSLEDWFERFKSSIPGALYYPELSKINSVVDSDSDGKLFPVAFRFPAFIVGQCFMYYWLALMSVHARLSFTMATLRQLTGMLEILGRDSLPCTCPVTEDPAQCLKHFELELLPPLGNRKEWPRAAAYNICQSVEYFLRHEYRGFGPASVLPPLALVKGFWVHAPGDWTREIAWADDMLRRVYVSGSEIAGSLD